MSADNINIENRLDYPIMTRVNKNTYESLKLLAAKTKDETVAGIVRGILHNRPVKIFQHDETNDLLLEELTGIRSELKHIGVNHNQITKSYNTFKDDRSRQLYAKMGLEQYKRIEEKVERLLELISKISVKWLSE